MIARTTFCACCMFFASSQFVSAQTALPPSVDSALVRYVGKIAVERLADAIAAAAQRDDQRWWQTSLPTGTDSLMWNRLERHLLMAVRGRDSVAGDTSMGILSVSRVRLNARADSLWFDMETGWAALCEGQWMENTRRATYIAYRRGTTWMSDVKEVGVLWSESFGCRR